MKISGVISVIWFLVFVTVVQEHDEFLLIAILEKRARDESDSVT